MSAVLACIGIGSNLGDRQAHITSAIEEMSWIPGCHLDQQSKIYETSPWGIEDQPKFLNAACGLICEISAETLLQHLQKIENHHNRRRTEKWGSRTLDLDIICYGEQRIETSSLSIPHPYFSERGFVLEPLAEIYPNVQIEGTSVESHFQNYLGNSA